MNEYIEREWLKRIAREDEYGMGLIDGAYWAQGEIDEAPTIDAVTEVRCKDCVYWAEEPDAVADLGRCDLTGNYTTDDFYCASGERRQREKE